MNLALWNENGTVVHVKGAVFKKSSCPESVADETEPAWKSRSTRISNKRDNFKRWSKRQAPTETTMVRGRRAQRHHGGSCDVNRPPAATAEGADQQRWKEC